MINTKHLINTIKDCVYENLVGIVSCNNDLQVIEECNAVVRKDYKTLCDNKKVLIISGGKHSKVFFITIYIFFFTKRDINI